MKRLHAPALLVIVALALSACSLTAGSRDPRDPPRPVGAADWVEPPKGYLPAGAHPDGQKILAPPPEVGSPTWKAELAQFEATRALVGSPRWTQAIRDADLSGKEAFDGFSCAAGVKLGPDTTPTLAKMLRRMIDDARPVYSPPKDFYGRKRPAVGNTAPICVPREAWLETNGAYPSGHALIGYSWSLILAELVPDQATALIIRGREFGDSRAICGVHWQSDVEAGRTLAAALVARLHADAGFQADLATARAEVAAARGLGTPERCPGA